MTCCDLDNPNDYLFMSYPTAGVVYGYISGSISLVWIVILTYVIHDYEKVLGKKTPELVNTPEMTENQDLSKDNIQANFGNIGVVCLELIGIEKNFKWALIPFMLAEFYMIYITYLTVQIFILNMDHVYIITGAVAVFYVASVDCVIGLFRRM